MFNHYECGSMILKDHRGSGIGDRGSGIGDRGSEIGDRGSSTPTLQPSTLQLFNLHLFNSSTLQLFNSSTLQLFNSSIQVSSASPRDLYICPPSITVHDSKRLFEIVRDCTRLSMIFRILQFCARNIWATEVLSGLFNC